VIYLEVIQNNVHSDAPIWLNQGSNWLLAGRSGSLPAKESQAGSAAHLIDISNGLNWP
jgi:hypothetical protein